MKLSIMTAVFFHLHFVAFFDLPQSQLPLFNGHNVLVTIELTAKLEELYEFEPDFELKTNK